MPRIEIESFFHNDTNTISHLVWEPASRKAALIDSVLDFDAASGRTALDSAEAIYAFIKQKDLELLYVLETHVHADHLSAAPFFKQHTNAQVVIGRDTHLVEKAFAPVFNLVDGGVADLNGQFFDRFVVDSETLKLGSQSITVLSTPGHTAGCVTYCVADAAFVGDTLFMPDYGTARADFPGGDARQLYQSIQKILSLPPETRLFMCHDYKSADRDEFAWETTVEEQRLKNVHVKEGVSENEYVTFRQQRDSQLSMPTLLLPSVQVNLRGGRLPEAQSNGVQYLRLPLNQF